jgi:hypothetical protein
MSGGVGDTIFFYLDFKSPRILWCIEQSPVLGQKAMGGGMEGILASMSRPVIVDLFTHSLNEVQGYFSVRLSGKNHQ